ncbi:MAG: triose-phosphate isomerase family protein, partial [Chloroflexota bacterium]
MSPRPLYFGTNFKMHQTPAESAAFYDALAGDAPRESGVQLFMIPPATSLAAVGAAAAARPAGIWIGAQNMHWAAQGAYTGEISAPMLVSLGVDLVLLGHAERRGLFHERDEDLNRKVLAAAEAGLKVLLCVGETADERRYGVGDETVLRQLKIGLHGLDPARAAQILVGYEPVWSIGEGGIPASPGDVAPVAATLRGALSRLFGAGAEAIPVLYGGSVNPENAG